MTLNMKKKIIPLSLTLVLILVDQGTKFLVNMLVKPWTVGWACFGDFFRIIHVYNPGIAFSLGGSLSDSIRSVLFGFMPLIMLLVILIVYFKNDEFSTLQRWSIAGIIGGGLGNLIDRFFRVDGVLDFIDVKFYGLFGLERWPTFNIADSSVVVCGILLMLSLIFTSQSKKEEKDE